MRINYKLSNVLGIAYKKGSIVFNKHNNSLFSPIGNQLAVYDLKRHESVIIDTRSNFNLTHLALSPCGSICIAVNEYGEAMIISLLTGALISSFKFPRPIDAICFSPDGNFIVVGIGVLVKLYAGVNITGSLSNLELLKTFAGLSEEVTSIHWASNSKAFIVGSKDSRPKVYPIVSQEQYNAYSIIGHKDSIVGAYFFRDSLDTVSVSSDGCVLFQTAHQDLADVGKPLIDTDGDEIYMYELKERKKYMYSNDQNVESRVMATDFNPDLNILVTGFENGLVMTHALPDFTLLDECQLFINPITSVSINKNGEWFSFGSEELGEIAVWEWRTKSAIMKLSAHANDMTCLAYSSDGLHLATGSSDCKLKIWYINGAKNIVSFQEHRASITGVLFPPSKPKVVISCSLDGTVRAFDLHRYRNFRTLTVPSRQVQFNTLASDDKGDLVIAGGQDTFDAYLWSVQNGSLLACLSGHQAPISCIQFSPSLITEGIEIATGSWDGTMKMWDVGSCYNNALSAEGDTISPAVVKNSVTCNKDVIALAYSPDGNHVSVVTIDSTISIFDVHTAQEVNFIEAKMDLGCQAPDADDLVNGKRIAVTSKLIRSITYSLDGQYLLAGGDSKYICLYSVVHGVLLRRFPITCNMSLGGVQEVHDRRQFLASLAKGSAGDALHEVEEMRSVLALPGVRSNDKHSRRFWRPEVRVACVKFSPTGDSFACSSTEGVLLFSLMSSGHRSTSGIEFDWVFDPISGGGLDMECTPLNARNELHLRNYSKALDMAMRLRMIPLIEEVIEQIPVSSVHFLVRNLSISAVSVCLVQFLATQLMQEDSRHVGFYMFWAHCVLKVHAAALKQGCASSLVSASHRSSEMQSTAELSEQKIKEKEALQESMKSPGILVERHDWSAFYGALLKLDVAAKRIQKSLFDKFDSIYGTIDYLTTVTKFVQNTSTKKDLQNEQMDTSENVTSTNEQRSTNDEDSEPEEDEKLPEPKQRKRRLMASPDPSSSSPVGNENRGKRKKLGAKSKLIAAR